MSLVANTLVGFVAVQHFLFGVLEAFFWTKPAGRKIFKISPEEQQHGAVLAKNQGVYNRAGASAQRPPRRPTSASPR